MSTLLFSSPSPEQLVTPAVLQKSPQCSANLMTFGATGVEGSLENCNAVENGYLPCSSAVPETGPFKSKSLETLDTGSSGRTVARSMGGSQITNPQLLPDLPVGEQITDKMAITVEGSLGQVIGVPCVLIGLIWLSARPYRWSLLIQSPMEQWQHFLPAQSNTPSGSIPGTVSSGTGGSDSKQAIELNSASRSSSFPTPSFVGVGVSSGLVSSSQHTSLCDETEPTLQR
jgi:hypothetical protein